MMLQHFGLKHYPLGKTPTELWDDGSLARLNERFTWLLESPSVGLLTGEAGVGKTAALRQWIIDEAQNLPVEFFRDLPAFLNFAFDSRDLMAVWLLGHPQLAHTLERAPYAALASRIQVRLRLKPIIDRERFKNLIEHALRQAGAQHTLLSDSGLELLRQASQGLPRQAGRILKTSMQLAVPKGLNHLPDELIQQAIEELI